MSFVVIKIDKEGNDFEDTFNTTVEAADAIRACNSNPHGSFTAIRLEKDGEIIWEAKYSDSVYEP